MPHRAMKRPHAQARWEVTALTPDGQDCSPMQGLDMGLGQEPEDVSAEDPVAGLLQLQVRLGSIKAAQTQHIMPICAPKARDQHLANALPRMQCGILVLWTATYPGILVLHARSRACSADSFIGQLQSGTQQDLRAANAACCFWCTCLHESRPIMASNQGRACGSGH